MSNFYNYDNRMFRVASGFFDCIVLSLFWLVTSIPLVTIGASTAALYYTVNKCVMNNRGHAYREYWTAFRNNFKQATIAWLLWLIPAVFLVLDLIITRQVLAQESPLGIFYYFFLVMMAVVLAWGFYLFTYIARFNGTVKEAMMKTIVYAIVNPGWSLLLVVIFVLGILVCNQVQSLIFLFPGAFAFVKNKILERIYKKYRTEEDILRELEENREYRN